MRRSRGLTLVGVLVIAAITAVVAALLIPAFARATERAQENARKATCLSNIKSIALACIMYAQDYDEVLPVCVADDRDGTAHAVGGVYANWKIEDLRRDVRAKYGGQYLDGRWMWQLGDVLLAARSEPMGGCVAIFACPTLARRDPYFQERRYIVGLDKGQDRTDSRDPLLKLVSDAKGVPVRKVWQSGSYTYMCMHHPYGAGVRASDYGADWLSLWDAANLLGLIGQPGSLDAVNPQDYLACANAEGAFDDPVNKPLLACRSFGVHEGYSREYAARHIIPPELAALFGLTESEVMPTIPVSIPMAFVDGHAKYVRASFYDMLALMMSPNKGDSAEAR